MAINSADVKHEVIRYMSNLARANDVKMDWRRTDAFGSNYLYIFSDRSTNDTIVTFEIDFAKVDDIFDTVFEIKKELKDRVTSHYACRGGYTYAAKTFVDYCKRDVDITLDISQLYPRNMIGAYGRIARTYASDQYIPEIKDVIFNDPATIIFWQDGDKTVVKAQGDDIFDPEKGLAMAITKKAFGNHGNYCEKIKPWLGKYEESLHPAIAFSRNLREAEENTRSNIWTAYHRLCNTLHDKKATKSDLGAAMEEAIGYLGEVLDD